MVKKFQCAFGSQCRNCHLQRGRRLNLLGDRVWVDGLGERRPGCMVLILCLGGEELIPTLRATVHTLYGMEACHCAGTTKFLGIVYMG